MHVKPSAVSNWISRGQLTAPALKPDGRIDAELARQQLGQTVPTGRSHHRSAGRRRAPRRNGRKAAPAENLPVRIGNRQAPALRRSSALGLVRADGAAEAWSVELSALLIAIEEWLPDLAQMLGASRELALTEWTKFRQRQADQRKAAEATLDHNGQ